MNIELDSRPMNTFLNRIRNESFIRTFFLTSIKCCTMRSWQRNLIFAYLLLVFVKILLSCFILAPSAFSDYYSYAKTAESFFENFELKVHDSLYTRPPLYPIILSPAYLFEDREIVYFLMKLINAIFSSLIIFPAWFLLREFFKEKKSFLITLIIALFPSNFAFTFLIMPENLFFPLFFLSIYFIFKSFTSKEYYWDIFSGIAIGLAFLTKINALVLPLVVGVILIFKLIKNDYKQIYKKIIMAATFLLTISPHLIRNGILFGFNKKIFLGSYGSSLEKVVSSVSGNSSVEFLLIFFTWILLNLSYIIIASGFLYFRSIPILFQRKKNNKVYLFALITSLSLIFLILLASRTFNLHDPISYITIFPWLKGKLVGRYLEPILPAVLILGFLSLKYVKKISKIYIIPLLIILIVSSQLVFFQLFPINNMGLIWLGLMKMAFDSIIAQKIVTQSNFSYLSAIMFGIILSSIFLGIMKLSKIKNSLKLIHLFLIVFSLMSFFSFAIIAYNSYTFWYKSEQTQIGLWFNEHDPSKSKILFDERDGCKIFKTKQECIYNPFSRGGFATIIGFWMNDDIKIGSVNESDGFDYIISKHNLNYNIVKKTKNGFFVYSNKKSKKFKRNI